MKKRFVILILLLHFFSSCCDEMDENTINNTCIEIIENSDWIAENFKSDYTIQLPNNYEGNGMIGWEGNYFNKNRTDGKVKLAYEFCDNGFYCYDFDYFNPLEIPFPDSIIAKDIENNEVLLHSKKEFCKNDSIIGILYHNNVNNATGKYYMTQTEIYLDGITRYVEGLSIYYENTEQQEVENIIKTIIEN